MARGAVVRTTSLGPSFLKRAVTWEGDPASWKLVTVRLTNGLVVRTAVQSRIIWIDADAQ